MIWTSKDGKSGLDLDKIGYWKYQSREEAVLYNEDMKKRRESFIGGFIPLKEERDELEVYMGSDGPLTFTEEDAVEIYKMLLSRREVI
jgi:hypothetical protein